MVTSGEKGDDPQLESLVEQSRSNGMEVDTVIGDTAYLQSRSMRRKVWVSRKETLALS